MGTSSKKKDMKISKTVFLVVLALASGQDPPDPDTTQPAEPTEPPTTTTTAKPETTTAVANRTCYDCFGEMVDGSVTKGDENCFTLNDLDGVGIKDVGPTGNCEAEAWYTEENGVITKGIKRAGNHDAGDVSLYPQEQWYSSEEVVCNTGTLCNDKDASGFFPSSFAHRSKRSTDFLEEESFMETFEYDDKTTTKAPTTTTPTTTVAPDFQCYMCNANSNGNVTELSSCMNPAETDASLDVCGVKIDDDSTLDTEQYTIERACNDADQPNDEKLKVEQWKKIKCLDSKCNSDKYDLGNSMTITLSIFAFLLSLLI